ncbi:DUF4421 family protein [Sphingobacterium athyrii]|uniref:DUF4421 domain-containing protein n=1 Tax=Sphingobacterium athyrii TaxID=2152717 RepID=A0A363NYB9_9SPHI|nr:DUF4421 family protein [Sphingobacterium athyrii]PUV25802.1 hypothetical protein DCO56_02165 [Sphingobacterium athyrii]
MLKNIVLFITMCLLSFCSKGQEIDTTFIYTYPNASWLTSYLSTSAVNMTTEDRTFEPNYPMKVGVGLGIRNTMINFLVGTKIVSLKDKTYGKTSSTDFQIHRYGRKFVTDIYFQRYKGFFAMDGRDINLFPEMKINQMGLEQTYLFNHTQFSLKAAFERSERQLQSAGSFLLGTNLYWHRLRDFEGAEGNLVQNLDNLQIGAQGGYVYSWVLDQHWLITAYTTIGFNIGNDLENFKKFHFKIYPTVLARTVASYTKDDWSFSYGMMINNKMNFFETKKDYTVTNITLQLSVTKQINFSFSKLGSG